MGETQNRMKEGRFRAKMNQMDLWLKTGIHYSTISRMERGYIKPTPEQAEGLAKALGVKREWLFPDTEEEAG
ncbi:MAG: helix-turn-helix transcriptional regulator [Deltaproteobacteria bacterium]|nr:helix-turn-helix transcriptional regulator [Deltaproteobacteria bacterium]